MKIDISNFYKSKGYKSVYVNTNKEPRRVALLVHEDGHKTSMSYSKYLYTSHYMEDVEKGYDIDHINGDKMDDRIENLQKISSRYNRQKDHQRREMVVKICPICNESFLFQKRMIRFKPNPCCSRRCGSIKSHQTKRTETTT